MSDLLATSSDTWRDRAADAPVIVTLTELWARALGLIEPGGS